MFITAMAANPLAVNLAAAEGINISWGLWAQAALVPGVICLLTVPLILYALYPPGALRVFAVCLFGCVVLFCGRRCYCVRGMQRSLLTSHPNNKQTNKPPQKQKLTTTETKDTPDAPEAAKKELAKLGPLSRDEKITAAAFAVTVALWIGGGSIGVNSVAAATVGLAVLLVTGVVSWKECLNNNAAWDTLTWFAALIAMAAYLNKFGFIPWLSKSVVEVREELFFCVLFCVCFVLSCVLSVCIFCLTTPIQPTHNPPKQKTNTTTKNNQKVVSGLGLTWQPAFGIILAVYFYSHYFFASGAAHIGAMYTAFLAVAKACGTPGMLAALALAQVSNLMGCLTTYGIGSAPPYFGAGYVPQAKWLQLGALMSVYYLAVWVGIGGLVWWRFLGIW